MTDDFKGSRVCRAAMLMMMNACSGAWRRPSARCSPGFVGAPRRAVSPSFFSPLSLFKGFSSFSLCGENGHNLLYGFKCCRHLLPFFPAPVRGFVANVPLKPPNGNHFINHRTIRFFSTADRRMTSQLKWDTRPRGWESEDPPPRRGRAIPA